MVNYKEHTQPIVNDEYQTVFKEAAQSLQATSHLNVLGEGYRDIIADGTAYNLYSEKLTEGFDTTTTEQLKQLFDNNRMEVLTETSVSGVPPIASLAMPAIVRVWAKFGLKNAIPTEVVSQPAFSIAFNKPYLVDPTTKEKYYLPDSLKDMDNELGGYNGGGKRLSTDPYTLPLKNKDLLGDVGCSVAAGDTVDKRFFVDEITMEALDKDGANPEIKTIKVASRLSLDRKIYLEKSVTHTDGTVTSDTVLGSLDLEKGTIKLVSLEGHIKTATFMGWISSESHNRSTETGFDIDKRDIEIGTGEHFEASLPMEFLNDTMAMYNINGASVVTDTMSNLIGQKLEQQIFSFLKNSQELNPTYQTEFDVYPSPHFTVQPKEWLEELKRVIDYQANKIKNDSYFYQGYFAIIGNPVDIALIPNVNWTFNSSSDNLNGIAVNYSLGAMSGTNKYVVLSSDLIPTGSLLMFMVPTVSGYLTYKYYPYTFNIVNNYLNAQGKKFPNIMMTKRHTIEEFMPLIAKIDILHNNGRIGYQTA